MSLSAGKASELHVLVVARTVLLRCRSASRYDSSRIASDSAAFKSLGLDSISLSLISASDIASIK